MSKETIARRFVACTHGWNQAFHQAIEANVMAEYRRTYPDGARDVEKTIGDMRTFYYARMVNTASLLVAAGALIASLASLAVALVALLKH